MLYSIAHGLRFGSRKVRNLLFKEKLKKGAVEGKVMAVDGSAEAQKTPSLHRLGGGVQQEKSTLFSRGLNPRFFLGLDIKNVWRA